MDKPIDEVLLIRLFQAIWTSFKREISCDNVLTNNTKALVYGSSKPGMCPALWHNGCYSWKEHLWVFISHNGRWQVIREDFNFRWPEDILSATHHSVPSLWCYLSQETCYAKNVQGGQHYFQPHMQRTNWDWEKTTMCNVLFKNISKT